MNPESILTFEFNAAHMQAYLDHVIEAIAKGMPVAIIDDLATATSTRTRPARELDAPGAVRIALTRLEAIEGDIESKGKSMSGMILPGWQVVMDEIREIRELLESGTGVND